MDGFIDICKMTQMELKLHLEGFLKENGYDPISEDGYLYAKGTEPVLLTAHLDTIHKKMPGKIMEVCGMISARNGIGGDDRCGVYIIMNIIKELKCSVLFCEDEECGTIGAGKFVKSDHINDINANYIIEFDRKGSDDAVFYDCDNVKFTEFILNTTGYKTGYGTHTDICEIAPAAKLAAVNLSCGYYKAHTDKEYVVVKEMMDTIDVAKKLIKTESEKYEYVKSKFASDRKTYYWNGKGRNGYTSNYDRGYYNDNYYGGYNYGYNYNKNKSYPQLELCMNIQFMNEFGEEESRKYTGKTKEEIFCKFFIDNPRNCWESIIDYILW